jgi:hypothetical protein
MRSKIWVVTGATLILLGLAALMHPNIRTRVKEDEVQIGGHKVIVETQRFFKIPAALGASVMLAGGALAFLGVRRR